MFTIDGNNTGFKPIEPGQYEVTPSAYEIKPSTNGNMRIIFNYEIRNDVEQDCQGQEILYDNFTVTDKSLWRINQASIAAGLPHGMQFNDYREWAETFKGRAIRVLVGQRVHEGKTYPEVKQFLPTNYPLKYNNHSANNNDPFSGYGKPIDISDADIPF